MSDGTLQVNAPELSSAARDADSAADRLLERYQSMSTEMAQVMEGRWTGAAAQACRSAWDEWSEGFRLTVMALRDEAQALRSAAASYASGDAGGASAIDAADLL